LVDIELLLAASFSTIFSKLNPDLHPSTINSPKILPANGDILYRDSKWIPSISMISSLSFVGCSNYSFAKLRLVRKHRTKRT
jgi:hypothetical protein